MKQSVKELAAKATIPELGITITGADDLNSVRIMGEGGIGQTTMRALEMRYINGHDLLGKTVEVQIGVMTASGYEYADYGSFLITEISEKKGSDTITAKGYDLMIKAMVPYTAPAIEYPTSLLEYTQILAAACGLELANTAFVHDDWLINEELYENIDGITYRDIFVEIAKVTASICVIGSDDRLYFKYITNTSETLTYSNLKSLDLMPEYGEINSVVLSRTPQNDDIYMRDDISIDQYGLTEFKIENNQIIDKDRDNAMTAIFDSLRGIRYFPFDAATEGLGWYEIGDRVTVQIGSGLTYSCVVFEFALTVDGGIKERLACSEPTKTQTQYQYATTIGRRIKSAELQVDKQANEIRALVSDMYSEGGLINESFTFIRQDIANITSAVQTAGGANLLLNSVMFAVDNDRLPMQWETSGAGSIDIRASNETLNAGGVSGNIFTLADLAVKQRVPVLPGSEYFFSCRVRKNAAGTAYIQLSNTDETHRIDFQNGESPFWATYSIGTLTPSLSYYDIEFYGSSDSTFSVTDAMFVHGSFAAQWQQANGELMNTQVNISQNGVLVRSSTYIGDYTVMSPLEFAGYAMVNGALTKVFSLNKDTTETVRLHVTHELRMEPLKIVPITTGQTPGWAIVPA